MNQKTKGYDTMEIIPFLERTKQTQQFSISQTALPLGSKSIHIKFLMVPTHMLNAPNHDHNHFN